MAGSLRLVSLDAGLALALSEGLALERERARAFNAGIRADEV